MGNYITHKLHSQYEHILGTLSVCVLTLLFYVSMMMMINCVRGDKTTGNKQSKKIQRKYTDT